MYIYVCIDCTIIYLRSHNSQSKNCIALRARVLDLLMIAMINYQLPAVRVELQIFRRRLCDHSLVCRSLADHGHGRRMEKAENPSRMCNLIMCVRALRISDWLLFVVWFLEALWPSEQFQKKERGKACIIHTNRMAYTILGPYHNQNTVTSNGVLLWSRFTV